MEGGGREGEGGWKQGGRGLEGGWRGRVLSIAQGFAPYDTHQAEENLPRAKRRCTRALEGGGASRNKELHKLPWETPLETRYDESNKYAPHRPKTKA